MERSGKQQSRDRLSVWLILLLPVLVVAAATFVFYTGIGLPSGTSNQGVLVQPPRDVKSVPFRDQKGQPVSYAELPFKWTLIIPVAADCQAGCRKRLYFTRQVHTALGRMQGSLRRFMVVTDGPLSADTVDLLARDHSDLTVLYLDRSVANQLFGAMEPDPATGQPAAYFLVDPGGFLMMSYTDDHNHKQLLHDLRFLIKESGEI